MVRQRRFIIFPACIAAVAMWFFLGTKVNAQSDQSQEPTIVDFKEIIEGAESRRQELRDRTVKSENLSFGEGVEMPRVDPPKFTQRARLDYVPDALPKGARAQYPAHDGARFHVTFSTEQRESLESKEIFESIIIPLLKAMGFKRDPVESHFLPPPNGILQKRASVSSLVDMVVAEHMQNRELLRPNTLKMIGVLRGVIAADDEINKAFQMGEGMTFNQYVAGIERQEIHYPFQQTDQGIPIEHTLVLAKRWQGQGVTSVSGSFVNDYKVTNEQRLSSLQVVKLLTDTLPQLAAVEKLSQPEDFREIDVKDGPHPILLPYGTDGAGVFELRLTYRLTFETQFAGETRFKMIAWLDAEDGAILKLESLTKNVFSSGRVFDRDPGVGSQIGSFNVDAANAGNYVLSLSGMSGRVDFEDDGYNVRDVSIAELTNGSSAVFANFDQTPINNVEQAICATGSNSNAFQQTHLFSKIHKYRGWAVGHGVFTPFPSAEWDIRVGDTSFCNANSGMRFGVCDGWTDPICPARTPGSTGTSRRINTALDDTIIAHEMGHNIMQRYTNERPGDWCGSPTCPIPIGWGQLHDLADFWADHFTSSNCNGGWHGKNHVSTNSHLNCIQHNENGLWPRLHELSVPFVPGTGTTGDHFPEHRDLASNDYADGQIGTAALWQVRLGMRSKCRPSGLPQFAVRFARAVKQTGLFTPMNVGDLLIYDYLNDLETKMLDEWATAGSPGGAPSFRHNGSHTGNKVTAGFAKAGLFLIPQQCIDGDNASADPTYCPAGENGADAVVDIDDNDPLDDLEINGVDHPEVDFLELGGAAPSFNVWTGSRYTFASSGEAALASSSPCNAEFQVEVSADTSFPTASTVQSMWMTVDRDTTTAASPECFGSWSPTAAQWLALQASGDGTLLYYRARTRQTDGSNVHLSTQPGNGVWNLPAPYAVLTANGQSDY